MAKIILIRHAETDWNKVKRIQGGGSNTPLNERGLRQAGGLARRLQTEELRAVYSSPLERALVTARAIAGYHNLEVAVEPSLREIEAGELEGVTVAEIGRHFSQILTANGQGETWPRIPGGESLPEVRQRAWRTIQRLVAEYPEETLAVVSHYFVILTIICSVLDLPLSRIGRFRLSTGGISVVEFSDQVSRLLVFNESC